MSQERPPGWLSRLQNAVSTRLERGAIPAVPLTVILACVVGLGGGYASILFTRLIHYVSALSYDPILDWAATNRQWLILLPFVPAVGLLLVAWFTRRFAPEAEGHGVPEVIAAVARHDGVIRPRVAAVKILASGVCIGTGGSVGREGPIVQIGSTLGSVAGQSFRLSARNIKVLVAAGAAAGISATFNAPLAGVMFASEIILGSFAVESLTPIVIASVLAAVIQVHYAEDGFTAPFAELKHVYEGAWGELPSYILLGLVCGLAAVGFTKLLYFCEEAAAHWIPKWWARAFLLGGLVGLISTFLLAPPPIVSETVKQRLETEHLPPALFGVGYDVVDHALRLEHVAKPTDSEEQGSPIDHRRTVRLHRSEMLGMLWWLLPLALLKPLLTSMTLAGGGSGGIFAPSLFLGATLGAAFGLICNLLAPEWSANPGLYAIVGMGAVVAGTTHGTLSAILIVYEMTGDYRIILPIMFAAGLSSLVARFVDPESIYEKKLSRRGELVSRGHDMHRVEHVMVRDVMIRDFPTVRHTDNVPQIVRVARANSHIESLPVMNDEEQLIGIIRPEDLHRVLDSDISPQLINADDIALKSPIAVAPDDNLLEALRDFGARDVETLPVEAGKGKSRRLVGLLLRSEVMRRYRVEMLRRR